MTDKVLKGNGKVNGLYYYIYIYMISVVYM